MPNQPNQPRQQAQSKQEQPAAAASFASKHAATLANAYVDMAKEQQEAAMEYQKRCHSAYFELVGQIQQAAAAARKPVEEAHRKLVSAAQEAQQNKEKIQDYQNAYQAFASSYGGQSGDQFEKALRKALETFEQTKREATEAAQHRTAEGYQKFVRTLKAVWNEIDPQNIDPDTVGVIEWATRVAAAAKV
jgi:hypothetical protein